MSVYMKSFEQTFETEESVSCNMIGLSSESSVKNNTIIKHQSLFFLNSLYQTLIGAGYSDTIKNDDDYSITLFGMKFYCGIKKRTYKVSTLYYYDYYPEFYVQGYNDCLCEQPTSNTASTENKIGDSSKKNFNYSIIVRGNNDAILISTVNNNIEKTAILIFKSQKIIDNNEMFIISKGIEKRAILIYKENIYNVNPTTYLFLDFISPCPKSLDFDVSNKHIIVPVLDVTHNFIIKGVLYGNTKKFFNGRYYKIGEKIYYSYVYINVASSEGLGILLEVG